MDQDTTKNNPDSADGRGWRERLGAGKELPKISHEFESAESNHADQQPQAKGAEGERIEPSLGLGSPKSPAPGGDQPRPRTPVARPAPMAPRAPRPATPAGDTAGAADSPGTKPTEPRRPSFTLSSKPASAQQPQRSGDVDTPKLAARPSWSAPSRSEAGSTSGHSPSFPRVSPSQGSSPSSTRGVPAVGNDAFSERLRAQREAAERLAQQRLAAARQRSGQAKTAAEQRSHGPSGAGPAAAHPTAKPLSAATGVEMPRFTFAEEEIAAAQRETAPEDAPAAGGGRAQPHVPPPYTPPHERAAAAEAPPDEPGAAVADEPVGSDAAGGAGGAYQVRPRDYDYDGEGMFEADQVPGPVPPRASAADYTAAYREFEEEFEDDAPPRRGGGPLILLLSLLALAMIGGGVIYWYQQSQGTVEPQAGDIPVISAPSEPVKATPEPEQQPQEAAVPARRKQIYDRILGEETLEPERIVPTEEQPQFRQIQQPQDQPAGPAVDQEQGFGTGEQNDSTDPRPLPLPPPPGTDQQGDLLLPDRSEPVTAAASPAPVPALAGRSDRARGDALVAPVAQWSRTATAGPDRLEGREATAPGAPDSARQRAPRDDAGERAPSTLAAAATPSDDSPVAPPRVVAVTTAEEPAALPAEEALPATAARQPDSASAPEADSEAAAPEQPAPTQDVELAAVSDEAEEPAAAPLPLPLPRTKPEPPVRTARASAPTPEPQRQAPRRSGPVQITPTLLAPESSSQASAAPRTQAPAPQPSRAPRIGRESDPLAGTRSANYASRGSAQRPASDSAQPAPAPQQQVASVEPRPAPSQSESGGGYLVQLAAFRTEAEAVSEYQRLVQAHPQLVGNLSSRIQQASLGQGGSFYRLGIGPLGDRNAATRLCNALIAAGEKDCLVRRR